MHDFLQFFEHIYNNYFQVLYGSPRPRVSLACFSLIFTFPYLCKSHNIFVENWMSQKIIKHILISPSLQGFFLLLLFACLFVPFVLLDLSLSTLNCHHVSELRQLNWGPDILNLPHLRLKPQSFKWELGKRKEIISTLAALTMPQIQCWGYKKSGWPLPVHWDTVALEQDLRQEKKPHFLTPFNQSEVSFMLVLKQELNYSLRATDSHCSYQKFILFVLSKHVFLCASSQDNLKSLKYIF